MFFDEQCKLSLGIYFQEPLIAANQAFILHLQALAAGTFLASLSKAT
jgi:hypothetical protein